MQVKNEKFQTLECRSNVVQTISSFPAKAPHMSPIYIFPSKLYRKQSVRFSIILYYHHRRRRHRAHDKFIKCYC